MGFFDKIKSILNKEIEGAGFAVDMENVRTDKLPVAPEWFFSARMGQPRDLNVGEVRSFAKSAWVQMVLNTMKKEVSIIDWEVVKEDDEEEQDFNVDIDKATAFFMRMNQEGDDVNDLYSEMITDIGEIDAGVLAKVYSANSYEMKQVPLLNDMGDVVGSEIKPVLKPLGQRELVQVRSADGSTFLKQVDVYRRLRAYYQYSFKNPRANPVRFEPDEIIYYQMNRRSYSIYGFCLPWDAVIETDTGKELIGEVVSQKKNVLVKTYNEEKKKFEYKRIVNYHSRHYNDRLYKICLADSEQFYCVRCTKEHPILTEKGYVSAENLTLKDKVIVRGNILTEEQKSFILGSLLGDSNLANKKHRGYPYYQVTHAENQKYYIDWIEKSLGNLKLRRTDGTHPSPHYPERIYKHTSLQSRVQPCLHDIRRFTYPEFKKKITPEWVDKLTPLSIAAWMMDDGSICKIKNKVSGFVFCTDSYSRDECNLLVEYFKKNDVVAKIMCPPSTNKNRIWINRKELQKLLGIVKDYFIIDYNLNKLWIAKPLEYSYDESGISIPITKIELTKKKGWQVFDIEVEDNHNFITNKIIVHNSPVQSIQQVLEVLIQSTRWNKDYFKNNAIPAGIIGLPNANKESMTAFQKDWDAKVKGKPHRLLFHNTAATFSNFMSNSKDMEWLEGQKWYFHLVFAVFGVSPVEAGFHENVNQSNTAGQERVTVKNAIKPFLKLNEKHMTKLISEILQKEDHGLVFRYKARDHAEEQIEHEQDMVEIDKGALTVNEFRRKNGRDPVEWGDTPGQGLDSQFGQEAQIDSNGNGGFNDSQGQEQDGNDKGKKEKPGRDPKSDAKGGKEATISYTKAFEMFVQAKEKMIGR